MLRQQAMIRERAADDVANEHIGRCANSENPPLVCAMSALELATECLFKRIHELEERLETVLYTPPPGVEGSCREALPGDAPMTCEAKRLLHRVTSMSDHIDSIMQRLEC